MDKIYERVIKGLECRLNINGSKYKHCLTCDYRHDIDHCQWACQTDGIFEDALALLKAQEPRVMTLGDLRNIGSVWESNTPPYLWMEINPFYNRWASGFWVAWREIYNMYVADNYGKIWRCWTSRPTKEQMEATPWS